MSGGEEGGYAYELPIQKKQFFAGKYFIYKFEASMRSRELPG